MMAMGCRGPFDPPSLCDRSQQQQQEQRERSPRRRESKSRQRGSGDQERQSRKRRSRPLLAHLQGQEPLLSLCSPSPLPIDRKLIQLASPTRQNSHITLGLMMANPINRRNDHEQSNKEVGDAGCKDVTTTSGILCTSCICSVSSCSWALLSSRNMAMKSCLSRMCRAAR
jgi:hypothetical protein